jgi:hypothetical protein
MDPDLGGPKTCRSCRSDPGPDPQHCSTQKNYKIRGFNDQISPLKMIHSLKNADIHDFKNENMNTILYLHGLYTPKIIKGNILLHK